MRPKCRTRSLWRPHNPDRSPAKATKVASIHGQPHKATVHRIAKRLGLHIEQLKGEGTRGQRTSHITVQDYEAHRRHFDVAPGSTSVPGSQDHLDAVLYLILTEPRLDPGRFKLGISTDVAERLRSHQTSAPFSELVKTWPCKARWEKTAIDCIVDGCEQLAPEVFRAEDLQDVIRRADRFFELMPTLPSA